MTLHEAISNLTYQKMQLQSNIYEQGQGLSDLYADLDGKELEKKKNILTLISARVKLEEIKEAPAYFRKLNLFSLLGIVGAGSLMLTPLVPFSLTSVVALGMAIGGPYVAFRTVKKKEIASYHQDELEQEISSLEKQGIALTDEIVCLQVLLVNKETELDQISQKLFNVKNHLQKLEKKQSSYFEACARKYHARDVGMYSLVEPPIQKSLVMSHKMTQRGEIR